MSGAQSDHTRILDAVLDDPIQLGVAPLIDYLFPRQITWFGIEHHPGSTTLSGGRMTTRARGAVVPDRGGGQRGVTKVNALWDNNVCRMARHRTLHPGAK